MVRVFVMGTTPLSSRQKVPAVPFSAFVVPGNCVHLHHFGSSKYFSVIDRGLWTTPKGFFHVGLYGRCVFLGALGKERIHH